MNKKQVHHILQITTFFLILNQFAHTQNLVPNSGFEYFIKCPTGITAKPREVLIPNWTMPTMGTSDYFNECSANAGVPKNSMGYKKAFSGNAYAGIITMLHFDENKTFNTREYLQVKLKNKLIQGQKYYVEIQYALAQNSKYSTDKLGILLTGKKIDSSSYIGNLPFVPQLETSSGNFVNSASYWTSLHDYYLAKGDEKYLIIGNFRNNKQTQWKENAGGTLNIAYYYIDEVSVYAVFDELEAELSFLQTNNNLPLIPELKTVFDPEKDYHTYNWYMFKNINFDFNDFEIKDNSYAEINKIIKTLIINPDLKILISGHTDSVGTNTFNKKLSEHRAKAVADYIIKNGIPSFRVKSVGFGDIKPIFTEKDSLLNEKNRRVEFMFFE